MTKLVADDREKIPVIAVLGPTASGKTSLAVRLAQHFNGEVISCDSMQIYQGMRIATAKPDENEMQGVRHHLIDFLSVDQRFSVSEFVPAAARAAEDISSRGKQVFLCGGTGLYADAFLQGMSFPEDDGAQEKRAELTEFFHARGIDALRERLLKLDPEAALSIDMDNPKRVLRAIEICESSGKTLKAYRADNIPPVSPYRVLRLCLDFKDREKLYDRINQRVDQMIEQGLEEEARAYYCLPSRCTASQAIGYKELKPYFDGALSFEEAAQNIKQATRRYAKRQLTWFRRFDSAHFLYVDAEDVYVQAARLCGEFLEGVKADEP